MAGGVEASWEWPDAGTAEAAVLSTVSEPTKWIVESAGWNFEQSLAQWSPQKRQAKASKGDDSEPSSPVATSSKKGDGKKKKPTSTKLTEAELEGDHYDMLGLSEREWEATEDEIQKAYKKRCLETHPDKTGGDDTLFKKVQVAGDVLLSENKRKAYDSSLPFDDSIPPAKVPAEEFYEEFGPVFQRNKKWYMFGQHKCPMLGDDSTPMEDVDAFYSFWLAFKSWRDFSHTAAEHDLEQAEYRDERRWMERENQRAVDKAKKNEMTRIITFVERAYKNDPRIKRRDQEREAEKEAIREAKRQEEERKRREAVEAAENAKRQEEERRKNKKETQAKEKKARQTIRRTLREMEGTGSDCILMVEVDWLLQKLELQGLEAVCAGLEGVAGDRPAIAQYVEEQIAAAEQRVQETRYGKSLVQKEEKKKTDSLAAAPEEATWTSDELLELQKACVKFPAGTMNRWEKLSEFLMGKKTAQQCLKQVKQLEREYRMPQQTSSLKAVSGQVNLPKAEKKDMSLSEGNVRQFKTESGEKHTDANAPSKDKPSDDKPKEDKPATDEAWSVAEQKALEGALRDLKAYKEKDKWDKIAAAVGSKTKKQCVARYKFLCSSVKK